MFRRLPKWIQSLDEGSLDKELLTQLFNASKKPIETPREMNFVVTGFTSKEEAVNAAYYAEHKGWKTSVTLQTDNKWRYEMESTKIDYAIQEHELFEDEADFVRIAQQYDAVYDGWYAEVV